MRLSEGPFLNFLAKVLAGGAVSTLWGVPGQQTLEGEPTATQGTKKRLHAWPRAPNNTKVIIKQMCVATWSAKFIVKTALVAT